MTTDNSKSNANDKIREIFTISFSTEDQPPHEVGVPDALDSPHDFEEAVEAAGYGFFNYLLIFSTLPAMWANLFDTTTISFVLPLAECDLRLTMYEKGMMNAAVYAGMIISAFFWGVLSDIKGRRPLLIVGYFADSICNVFCSMSQSFTAVMILKFVSGCLISGPFAITMSYLTEFHGTKYRSKVLLFARLFQPLGNLVLPGLAWSILPQSWSFTLFEGSFVYNSWRIFLLVCSMPAFLASLALLYLPESPRFLMFQGKNDEALKVFQRIYSTNTGKPPETFPVKALRLDVRGNETSAIDRRSVPDVWQKTREGLRQIKPLFLQPYLLQFILITVVQFGSLLSLNTLRLWMPQIFTLMENFDYENRDADLGSPSLCEILNANKNSSSFQTYEDLNDTIATIVTTCVVAPVRGKIYINSIILAVTSIIGYVVVANSVNFVGKKNILLFLFVVPAVCSFVLNWSSNSDLTLAIFAVYLALTGVSTTTSMNLILELMPTSLRTTALSISLCIGRCGAMIGNILFPILLSHGCTLPFIFVGCFLIVCFVVSIFIPKPPVKLM